MMEFWANPIRQTPPLPGNVTLSKQFSFAEQIYSEVCSLCSPKHYNIVLHKHLGDNFYIIGSKRQIEKALNGPVRFIVQPHHEFLMKLWQVEDYSVFGLDQLIRKNTPFLKSCFDGRDPNKVEKDDLDNLFTQALFGSIPILGRPFVAENPYNNFFEYPLYWCYRWASNCGVEQEYRFEIPAGRLELSRNAIEALDYLGGLDKTIVFAPEAATAIELPPEWWNELGKEFVKHGWSVLVNSNRIKVEGSFNAFDLGLSLEDIVAISLSCRAVFALRSGLCDVLVSAGSRLYVINPAMLRREQYGLTMPFERSTNVNEFQLHNWQVHPKNLEFDGIDLSGFLQKKVDILHKEYVGLEIRRAFGSRKARFWKNILTDVAGNSRCFFENNSMNPPEKNAEAYLGPVRIFSKRVEIINNETVLVCKYFGGIVSSRRKDYDYKVKVLGIPVFRKRRERCRDTYLFGIRIKSKDRMREFKQYLQNGIAKMSEEVYGKGNAADHVFIIRHNMGESTVYLSQLKRWTESLQAKRPILVAWREKDLSFYRLFSDNDIPIRLLPISLRDLGIFLIEEEFRIGETMVHVPTYEIGKRLREQKERDSQVSFASWILESMGFSNFSKNTAPAPKSIDFDRARWILGQLGASQEQPYALVCPKAVSIQEKSIEFWQDICCQLRKRGLTVIVNRSRDEWPLDDVYFCYPEISTLYAMANRASLVISMASGLGVLLSAANPSVILFYTAFNDKELGITAEFAKSLYSVHYLPWNNSKQTKEFCVDRNSSFAIPE